MRQRTSTINRVRGFLIERGITVQQRLVLLRKALFDILASGPGAVSSRMLRLPEDIAVEWPRLRLRELAG